MAISQPPEHEIVQPGPGTALDRPTGRHKAVASLVLAIVAPVSLLFTAPFANFALLLTFPYDGPSKYPWAAPLALWSLPLIFGSVSVSLALFTLRKWGRASEGHGLVMASLWISGVIFLIGLIFTLRFVSMMR